MQADTARRRATIVLGSRQSVHLDAVSKSQHALAGPWSCGNATANRRGVEGRQQGLLTCERINLLRAQPATLEHPGDTAGDTANDAFHLLVVGWR